MLFRILFFINAIAAAVAAFFFVLGILDGSVSSFNAGLWLALLAAFAGILFGGYQLDKSGRRRAAIALLAILAIPMVLFGLFMAIVMVAPPRWN